jgi:hypothetical protein
MPYLSPELLSNYYFITMGGKRYLLDSWTEITQQDVNDISMIQGDIGNRVIDISNPFHQVTMNGPLVILRDLDNQLSNTATTEIAPANVNDIFDLVKNNIGSVVDILVSNNRPFYILDSASLNIEQEDVSMTATITSTQTNGFDTSVVTPVSATRLFQDTRALGRTVRFWDFRLRLFGDFFPVTRATINFKVVSEKVFNLGNNVAYGNTYPDFLVTGHAINGEVTIAILPSQYETFKLYQAPGSFNVFQNEMFLQLIDGYRGNRSFNFGEYLTLPRISLDMGSNKMITAVISFNMFLRRHVPVV